MYAIGPAEPASSALRAHEASAVTRPRIPRRLEHAGNGDALSRTFPNDGLWTSDVRHTLSLMTQGLRYSRLRYLFASVGCSKDSVRASKTNL